MLKIFKNNQFLLILLFRLLNALLLQTYFSPDEYYQSIEPAYLRAFHPHYWHQNLQRQDGYLDGTTGITWEWYLALRSSIMVELLSFVYRLIRQLGADSSLVVRLAPRIVSSIIWSIGDYFFVKFISRDFPEYRRFSRIIIFSWISIYLAPRYLGNSMEASLSSVALYFWPFIQNDHKNLMLSVCLATITFFIRPTSAIQWVVLYLCLSSRCLISSFFTAFICILIDYNFYKTWQLVPWNFLNFNIIQNVSEFYGTHNALWYLISGIPTYLLSFTPLFIYGLSQTLLNTNKFSSESKFLIAKDLTLTILATILMLSTVKHKEFRFLSAIHHQLTFFSLVGASSLFDYIQRKQLRLGRVILYALYTTQIMFGIYFLRFHQTGVINIFESLIQSQNVFGPQFNVLFAMPCHSTPWYSQMHFRGQSALPNMRFITCVPPLNQQQLLKYEDESYVFYKNASKELQNYLNQGNYSHIVLFEDLSSQVDSVLSKNNFEIKLKFFNSHFIDDDRRRGKILIYESVD